ncbi:MAG TPA: DNA-binding protein [Paenalcaligenes sp.]|nr:DNA-binding protein [Paenalcaligenes sp.]
MATQTHSDIDLQRDVDALRQRFSHTQALYREVAALLFFRYGITPTANRLYQLVRKGSMSAPAQALQDFWQELRDKSRVRIDHADIPEALMDQVAQLTTQLWHEALTQAKGSYQAFYDEAETKVAEAKHQLALCEEQWDNTKAALSLAHETLASSQNESEQQRSEIAQLKQELAVSIEAHKSALADKDALAQRLEKQHAQFTHDLEKMQNAIALTEERARATERMALLEIDKERGLRLKNEKTLAATIDEQKQQLNELEQRLRTQGEALAVSQHQLTATKAQQAQSGLQLTELENRLSSAQENNIKYQTEAAVTKQENHFLKQKIDDLQQQLHQAQEQKRVSLPRRYRRE